jgi:hypothetical protein
MTSYEEKYIQICKNMEILYQQIKQLESEYEFLRERILDSYAQTLYKTTACVVDDPKAKELFPKELIDSINETRKEMDEDLDLDTNELVGQTKQIIEELGTLHEKLIVDTDNLEKLINEHSIGELGDDIFLKAKLEDSVEDSRESFVKMVKLLKEQHKEMDNFLVK